MTGRRAAATALTLVALLLATACSPAQALLGIEANTAPPADAPALTAGQANAIAGRALGQAQRADALRTAEAAQTAFTGLALRVAPSTYVVDKVLDPASKTPGKVLSPMVSPSRVVVTAGRAYPRTLLAVWQPEGASSQQLVILDSSDVRTPFRVATRTDLLAGASLPPMAPNTEGAPVLGPDVGGLVATPRAAVRDLAMMLQTGRSPGTQFSASVVVRDVRANAVGQAKDVAQVATFQQTHAPEQDAPRVIRAADGGALVIAAIDRIDRFTVKKGAGSISPPAAYRALGRGLAKITTSASVTTVQVVAIVLPPIGKGPARIIGFSEMPVAVQGS